MDWIVIFAELATLLWFLAFFGLLHATRQAAAGRPAPRLDARGRRVTVHARIALVSGIALLFLLTVLQLADHLLGLGLVRIF